MLGRWNAMRAIEFRFSTTHIGTALDMGDREYSKALAILHEARHGVELRGDVATSTFVDKGNVHDFFEEVRTLVARAKSDLLIADRYLNADFVAKFAPFMTSGTHVRLLVRSPDRTLLPAIDTAITQYGLTVNVRAHDQVHDRYLFIDRAACYHSGASFADGGKSGPTIIAPILGFEELLAKYDAMWDCGGAIR